MEQSAKYFSQQLKYCLDELGAPINHRERSTILSKMLFIPKQQAWSLMEGHAFPDVDLLKKIAAEFEVETDFFVKKK